MTLLIRSLEEGDIPEFIKLMESFAIFDGSLDELYIDESATLQAFIGSGNKINAIVLENENRLTGFLSYYYAFSSFALRPILWIEDVFIIEKFRGKGWGVRLFKKAREIAIKENCVRLEWHVRAENEIGIEFYNKLGAKVDHGTFDVHWKI